MHFVYKSDCPVLLKDNKDKWTIPWLAYYKKDAFVGPLEKALNKPKDGNWRKDEIRSVLIADFNKNCGYCGSLIPTPIDYDNAEIAGKGDVDHFLAKAVHPHLTYEWDNYIWSCKPCNQLKGEFDDEEHPLFNPCLRSDCELFSFIEDSGQYALLSEVSADPLLIERFKNHETNTLLNSSEIQRKRRNIITILRGRFESIANSMDMCTNLSLMKNTCNMISETVICINAQIDTDKEEIKNNLLTNPEFYLLIKDRYELLRREYPNVSLLIDEG